MSDTARLLREHYEAFMKPRAAASDDAFRDQIRSRVREAASAAGIDSSKPASTDVTEAAPDTTGSSPAVREINYCAAPRVTAMWPTTPSEVAARPEAENDNAHRIDQSTDVGEDESARRR